MSKAEVMLIMILFYGLGHSFLKHFNRKGIQIYVLPLPESPLMQPILGT